DWSYDLLSEQERELFRRLSVFAGGFDLAGVEAIWPDRDPLDHIEQLVDKSLLTVEQLDDEKLRYRLLETLRQYGAERLAEAGEEEEARERHFGHYLAVAERAYQQRIEHEAASLAALEADHDDFRVALEWARSRPRDLLRLASALGWFWHLRSHYREGRTRLEEALRLNPAERSGEKARALWALSMILNWQGEPKFVHFSLHYLADCALWRGDAKNAVQLYGESLRAALDYGNEMEAATEMQGMAMGLMGSERQEEGFRLYGASCARLTELHTTMIDEVAFWVKFRERYLPPARERIGAVAADKAEKEGRAMGWQKALACAF